MRCARVPAMMGFLMICVAACGTSPTHSEGSSSSTTPKSSTASSATTRTRTTPGQPLFGYPPSNPAAFSGAPAGPECSPGALTLAWGGYVSEKTQQRSLGVDLKNVSGETCHIMGYPGISFLDANGVDLPLTYRRGGDQMVTSSPPASVNLPAGSTAYVLMNQSACELGEQGSATTLRLIPPNATSSLELGFAQIHSSVITYCGSPDPGSTVNISPVEPTAQDTFAQ